MSNPACGCEECEGERCEACRGCCEMHATERELEETANEMEYWYLVTRALLAAIIRRQGTDAASSLLDGVRAFALADFPSSSISAHLVDSTVGLLLTDIERLSETWKARGTLRSDAEEAAHG